ncbi:MAG TPA: T9SS type A sorting domain-containing protein [Chitinophagaceae bacterium]|nr:T9SS type A sorting domain-containing protein [Chitinophagaceae bacterium]
MKKFYFLFVLFIGGSLMAQPYIYHFDNSLAASGSGPTLTEALDGTCGATNGSFNSQLINTNNGSCVTKPAFDFTAGGGLSFDNSSSLIGGTYTIHIICKFNSIPGYVRVMDFQNGTDDNGVYINSSGCLGLHPGTGVVTSGNCNVTAGVFTLISLIRDGATDSVHLYLDGSLIARWLDDGSNDGGTIEYAPSTATTPVIFFRDNTSGGTTCEAAAGSIEYLYLNPATSTETDVANVFNNICGTVLPLNLLDFSASKQNNMVALNWVTANEVNVSHFELERSGDGRNFGKIGEVAATNSLLSRNYNYNDANPLNGTNFYRLKMVDIDNRYTYSGIVKINFSGTQVFGVYPNPAKDEITVDGIKAGLQIVIISGDGKMLAKKISSGQSNTFDVSKYPSGIYIVQCFDGEKLQTQKIIKQ